VELQRAIGAVEHHAFQPAAVQRQSKHTRQPFALSKIYI
jgi:hypothetical protein